MATSTLSYGVPPPPSHGTPPERHRAPSTEDRPTLHTTPAESPPTTPRRVRRSQLHGRRPPLRSRRPTPPPLTRPHRVTTISDNQPHPFSACRHERNFRPTSSQRKHHHHFELRPAILVPPLTSSRPPRTRAAAPARPPSPPPRHLHTPTSYDADTYMPSSESGGRTRRSSVPGPSLPLAGPFPIVFVPPNRREPRPAHAISSFQPPPNPLTFDAPPHRAILRCADSLCTIIVIISRAIPSDPRTIPRRPKTTGRLAYSGRPSESTYTHPAGALCFTEPDDLLSQPRPTTPSRPSVTFPCAHVPHHTKPPFRRRTELHPNRPPSRAKPFAATITPPRANGIHHPIPSPSVHYHRVSLVLPQPMSHYGAMLEWCIWCWFLE